MYDPYRTYPHTNNVGRILQDASYIVVCGYRIAYKMLKQRFPVEILVGILQDNLSHIL